MEIARVKLKWNNHHCVFSHYLQDYCNQPRFSDAMIACGNRTFMVHRIVLSTCSQFFEEIFNRAPNDNARPVVIINDSPMDCVEWLLNYMYCGEVTVPKDSLPLLFKLAEQLQVKGLSRLHVPEATCMPPAAPGVGEIQKDSLNRTEVQKATKRKCSSGSSSSSKSKKITSPIPVVSQPEGLGPSLVNPNPSIPVASRPEGTTFVVTIPQNAPFMASPLNGPINGPVPSSKILMPPTATLFQGGVISENRPSTTMDWITVPSTSFTSQIQANSIVVPVSSPSTCFTSKIQANSKVVPASSPSTSFTSQVQANSNVIPVSSNGSEMLQTPSIDTSILASRLLGKEDRTVFAPSGAGMVNGYSIDDTSNNSTSAGKCSESTMMIDIKEEMKEEPFTLGPDDPMTTEEDEDDDYSGWSVTEFDTDTSNGMEKGGSSDPQPEVGRMSSTRPMCMIQMSPIKDAAEKKVLAEQEKEPVATGPSHGTHILPRILVKPMHGPQVILKSKEKSKSHQSQEQVQQQKQELQLQSVSSCEKTPAPQKTQEKTDVSPSTFIRTRIVKGGSEQKTPELAVKPTQSVAKSERPLGPSPINKSFRESLSHVEDDPALREMMEFFQEEEDMDGNPTFVPLDSHRKRNPPYLIRSSKIATKNEEPVKFCLRGAKGNHGISISLRYTEEKFKHIPVHSCRLHQRNDDRFNFLVSAVGDNVLTITYKEEGGHATAHLNVDQQSIDNLSKFIFSVTFICLNSCHKENGKKMELILKLFDFTTNLQLMEKHFEIRVCKNVKRDYKEAIQAETTITGHTDCLKVLVRPDSFLYPEEVPAMQSDNQNATKEGGVHSPFENSASKNNVPVITASGPQVPGLSEDPNHGFYLVRLPHSKRGKMVLDLVREFEKTISDLEPKSSDQDLLEKSPDSQ